MSSLFEGMENFDAPLVETVDDKSPLEILNESTDLMEVEGHKMEDEVEKTIQASEDIEFIEEFAVELESHPHNSDFILGQLEKKLNQVAGRYGIPRAREVSMKFSKESFHKSERIEREAAIEEARILIATMKDSIAVSNEGFMDTIKEMGGRVSYGIRKFFGKTKAIEDLVHRLKDGETYTAEGSTKKQIKINAFNVNPEGFTTGEMIKALDNLGTNVELIGQLFEFIKVNFSKMDEGSLDKEFDKIAKQFPKYPMVLSLWTISKSNEKTGFVINKHPDIGKGGEKITTTKKELEGVYNHILKTFERIDRVGSLMNKGIDEILRVKPDDLTSGQRRASILFNNGNGMFKVLVDCLFYIGAIMMEIGQSIRKGM